MLGQYQGSRCTCSSNTDLRWACISRPHSSSSSITRTKYRRDMLRMRTLRRASHRTMLLLAEATCRRTIIKVWRLARMLSNCSALYCAVCIGAVVRELARVHCCCMQSMARLSEAILAIDLTVEYVRICLVK